MIVVAGPPGSGKTRYFPVTAFGVDAFNIDDRCAQILGSYRAIPRDVRRAVAKECERFVLDHIERRESFAVETTLRTTAAIDQAELARKNGFATEMHSSPRTRLPRTSRACFSARRRAATLRPSGRKCSPKWGSTKWTLLPPPERERLRRRDNHALLPPQPSTFPALHGGRRRSCSSSKLRRSWPYAERGDPEPYARPADRGARAPLAGPCPTLPRLMKSTSAFNLGAMFTRLG
jgi:hypothetical protein